LLVLSFGYDNSALTYFSVSDSKNNAWAQAVGPTDVAGGRAYTLYAKNIAGGGAPVTATITLSGTPTSVFDVILSEYAGVDTTSPLDQTSSGTGNSLALDSGAKYLSGVPQLVYGFGAAANAATVDSPYTNRESIMGAFAADQTVFSTGSYHVTGTQNVAGQWLLQMATFKGA
ncbi:MAG TPA: hypothetical protein VMB35_03095, partial [Methanomicrobiales archaeon]|nr:hypothetical protein [Methanomicrobiales archaeon]